MKWVKRTVRRPVYKYTYAIGDRVEEGETLPEGAAFIRMDAMGYKDVVYTMPLDEFVLLAEAHQAE